jgi:hypothetical protein
MENSIDRDWESAGAADASHSGGSASAFVGMIGCFAALLVMFVA